MTIRASTGTRNALASSLGLAGAFNKGSIDIYTGTQPATADAATTGTLLGTITISSGALTKETQASQTITVAGASGSINTVTVGTLNIIPDGTVAFRTDVNTTASDLCDAINRNGLFTATVSAAVVTVKPRPGAGTTYNGVAFATTVTTLTATVGAGTLSGGVAAVNGLFFGSAAAGVISKPTTSVWSFIGVAAGTAGWFRLKGSVADADALISAAPYLCRIDGSVASSGGDLNLSNLVIAVSAPTTVDSFSVTIPAS